VNIRRTLVALIASSMDARRFLLIAGVIGIAGCATVPPYERGPLAHPTMKTSDPAGVGEAHARAIQEGAMGGGFEVGGGCGCN
jgi:hypothetical protein